MKTKLTLLWNISLLSVLLFCSPFSSYFSADGYIVNKASKLPIENANVTLTVNNKGSNTVSDKNGYFRISLSIFPDSSDVAVLLIQKDGFKAFSQATYSLLSGLPDTFLLESSASMR